MLRAKMGDVEAIITIVDCKRVAKDDASVIIPAMITEPKTEERKRMVCETILTLPRDR
ncbi:MAG: hypothetical protein QW566_08475 [Candidatus Jordarchaeales archaeon]